MNDAMNEYISRLRDDALKMFPGATLVEIFISHDQVEVIPHYSGEHAETSMRTLSGKWCTKRRDVLC